MNIAFLCSRVPYPLTSGFTVRAYNIILQLGRNHDVTVYAIGEKAAGHELSLRCGVKVKTFSRSPAETGRNLIRGFFTGHPLQVALYQNESLRESLAADVESGRIDLLFVHLLRMVEYAKAFPHVSSVLDAVDSICLNYHRTRMSWSRPFSWAVRLDRGRVCRYEAAMYEHFCRVFVTSPVDAQVMRVRAKVGHKIEVLPNGVDLSRFRPFSGQRDLNRIVFAGKLDYIPNADAAIYFAREVFPHIRASEASAELTVAGFNPPASVAKLKSIDGVSIAANVPDLGWEMSRCGFSVAPLRAGAGIQNKVLEAFAVGLPVICPPHVAYPIVGNQQLPFLKVARTTEEYVKAALHLLRNPDFIQRLGTMARTWVQEKFDWNYVMEPMLRSVREVASEPVVLRVEAEESKSRVRCP